MQFRRPSLTYGKRKTWSMMRGMGLQNYQGLDDRQVDLTDIVRMGPSSHQMFTVNGEPEHARAAFLRRPFFQQQSLKEEDHGYEEDAGRL